MAGKKGAPDIKILYDNIGGTPVDISNKVRAINGVNVEHLQEESHGFGVAWFESAFVGVNRIEDITLDFHYEAGTSDDMHDLFSEIPTAATGTRTLAVEFGRTAGDKRFAFETKKLKYDRMPKLNALVGARAVLKATGEPDADETV